jgi:predicted protein tyrosine phosphatase
MTFKSTLVPFGITVCGIDELASFAGHGVSHVLSIMDPGQPEPPALATFPAHARLDLRFHDIIEERVGEIAPMVSDVDLLLAFGRDLEAEPRERAHLLVHCHAGISRSTASMVLLLAQARPDRHARDIVGEVVRIRPRAWPNLRIVRLGDGLLKREGALISAVREQYARRLAETPELAQIFREVGREAEIEGLI